jgi:hypothetical protein
VNEYWIVGFGLMLRVSRSFLRFGDSCFRMRNFDGCTSGCSSPSLLARRAVLLFVSRPKKQTEPECGQCGIALRPGSVRCHFCEWPVPRSSGTAAGNKDTVNSVSSPRAGGSFWVPLLLLAFPTRSSTRWSTGSAVRVRNSKRKPDRSVVKCGITLRPGSVRCHFCEWPVPRSTEPVTTDKARRTRSR